jgi:hypothetical protein
MKRRRRMRGEVEGSIRMMNTMQTAAAAYNTMPPPCRVVVARARCSAKELYATD